MPSALAQLDIHRPRDYARHGYPWAAWDALRRLAPVYWYEREDIEPFWAVTRHADILAVADQPDVFINGGPRLRLALRGETELLRAGVDSFGASRGWDPDEPPDMVFMDNPRHRHFRRSSSWAFTQHAMRDLDRHLAALAQRFTREFIAALEDAPDHTGDFVSGLACKLPLAAIGEIMGLPASDWRQILVWSKALVGEVDDADRRAGESIGRAAYRSMAELRGYIEELIADSRAHGATRGGFVDRLVHTPVQGRLLTDQQLNGYLFLLIAAGNDTTRNALAGGVAALIEHPAELARLRADPGLLPAAVEEILRWTSPVGSFLRTATADVTLAGQRIAAGDTVALFYPSANRDEQVFPAPYRFDIGRSPNPHLAFGFGAHFCLGTNLARAELRASLAALLPWLGRLEIHGTPTWLAQTHVMGYSSLPLRLRAAG